MYVKFGLSYVRFGYERLEQVWLSLGWNDVIDEKQEGKEKGSKNRQTDTECHTSRLSLDVVEEEQVQYVYMLMDENNGKEI